MRSTGNGHDFERRNSHRYPLHLEVILNTATEEFRARTIDISPGGIFFQTETDIQVDSPVEFTIVIPVEAVGTEHPVLMKCLGRVVRSSENTSGWSIAVVIDEYEFVQPHSAD
jgi:PilZ domain-containing protein